MNLKFLGRGSAFNTAEGNTSAYIKDNNWHMLLIDCGETVFSKIIKLNLLDDINRLDVIITHTHPDHIGSLGSLIFYCYYIKKINVNVITKYEYIVKNILLLNGVESTMYNISRTAVDSVWRFELFKIDHCTYMKSSYINLYIDDNQILYIGDT